MTKSIDSRRLIYSNYYGDAYSEEEIADYLFQEHCETFGWISREDVPQSMIDEEIADLLNDDWDMEKNRLEHFLSGHRWLVMGYVQLWTGNHPAGKVITSFNELSVAWRDCDYISFYDEDGHFYIKCSHHDGTNSFELRKLTKRGEEYLEEHEYDDDYTVHTELFSKEIYTTLPYYADAVFGKIAS